MALTHEQADIGQRVRCVRPLTSRFNPTGEGVIVDVRRHVVFALFEGDKRAQVFYANELELIETVP